MTTAAEVWVISDKMLSDATCGICCLAMKTFHLNKILPPLLADGAFSSQLKALAGDLSPSDGADPGADRGGA